MAKQTIAEFVAGMGFEINEADQRRFYTAIEGATLRANLLSSALELMAKTAVGKIGEVATQFEALYNQAQRLGTTGPSIRAFEFAVRQVHGSVEGANAALQSFGEFLKNLPPQAAENIAKQLRIPIEDTKDKAKFLLDIYERLSHMPGYLANQFRDTYHLGNWSDFQQVIGDPAGAMKAYNEEMKRQSGAGITDEAMKKQGELVTKWLEFSQKIDDYARQSELNISHYGITMLDILNKYIDEHQKKISEFVDWSTKFGFVTDVGKTKFHFDEAKFAEHFETALKAAESATVLQLKDLDDALRPVVTWFERFGRTLSGFFTQPYLDQNGQPEVLPGASGGGLFGRMWGGVKRFFGGGSGSQVVPPGPPGTYRPQYRLSAKDLSDAVVNTIAGEASTKNPAAIDAVINNMFNRLGSKGYGPSGNLEEVARAPGQYTGYRSASAAEAEMIRARIRAIASGGVSDNTHNSMEYRGAWLYYPFMMRHPGGTGVGGNWFFPTNVHEGPYAAYAHPHMAAPGGPAMGYGHAPIAWDTGPAWAALNAHLPVGPSSVDNSSRAVNSTVNNSIVVNAPDPHSAASMVGVHLDRTANDVSRNLQGAFQ